MFLLKMLPWNIPVLLKGCKSVTKTLKGCQSSVLSMSTTMDHCLSNSK